LEKQIGFTINFKMSCDAIVEYITRVNNAEDIEDYGRAMINMFFLLNGIKDDESVTVDTQIELEREPVCCDVFSQNLVQTVKELINIDFNWHIFFLILFNVERGNNADDLESFILYYKNQVLATDAFDRLGDLEPHMVQMIKIDILNRVSEQIKEIQKIELLCPVGIQRIKKGIGVLVESFRGDSETEPINWEGTKNKYLLAIDKAMREG